MPTPMTSESFGDLLDPRFQKIFSDTYKQLPDMLGDIYTMVPTNGRNNMTFSETGTLSDWDEFTGTIPYTAISQGYDVTMTPVEFGKGTQVGRKLYDDDQYHVMDQKPKSMATSAHRTRQKHGHRIFNNAFSVDTLFYNHSEGVALCSNSHTTTSGASTASGFDNLTTASLTATAVFAARLQMIGFRGDQAERIEVMPDELWYPPDLSEQAFEIVKSQGKVDTANNNRNFHEGRYKTHECRYMTDTNNWFMCDSSMRREFLFWCDRIPVEFAFIEDFDTLVAKWRGYGRWGMTYVNWRWICGSQVT
jgi:phage major head subunit gpT-like protein